MAFTILDNDESFASNPQSLWMQTDINAIIAGIGGDGVVSGCAVTAQGSPDMTVAVAIGTINIAGAAVAVAAGNVTITAADVTNPRIDLVVVSNAGVKSVTAGTAAANPKAPDIPANSVLLAMVYVPANDTTIATNQITDKRVIAVALITGGGTLALAGFVVAAPASLTIAGLGIANVFTANQRVNALVGIGVAPTYGLHIAPTSGITALQTAFFHDATVTTGKTKVVIKSGAANSLITTTEYLLEFQNSGGTVIGGFRADGALFTSLLSTQDAATAALAQAIGTPDIKVGLNFRDTAGIVWAASGLWYNTKDLGIARNAAAILEVNTGTAGQWGALKAGTRDAGTATITDGLTLGHQSTGTPAAGLGTGIQLNINSSTTADQNAARLTAEWVVATHASRTARATLQVYDTAAREGLRIEASGSAPMIGFLGAAASVRQTGGENLINNVTSGGTDGTIANYTDLVVYANDAAAIRNDIYQLSRAVKQSRDAMRLYGLLT